jgi:UDP-N-acetyl-D-mannosaminuronic acid transferase (WecB/TagA/CpsF family)
MVLLWRLLRGRRLTRISGLAYLQALLRRPDLREDGASLWILPNEAALEKAVPWLESHGFAAAAKDSYVAPIYGSSVEDSVLLERILTRQPRHVVIALSGGVQEKLGFYLREKTSHRPALHCIGAALGFITGYQIAIPPWADRLFLGWFLRLISQPRRFLPRALQAAALPRMIVKYGENLPPLSSG